MRLTKTVADRATYKGRGAETLYWDDEVKGFALRVSRGGTKAWILNYRDAQRRERRITLGRYSTALSVRSARELAKAKLHGLAWGVDPAEEARKARRGDTLKAAADGYLKDRKLRAESGQGRGRLSGWDAQRRLLELHVLPAFGHRKLAEITAADLRRLHRKLADRPVTADHVRGAVHAVFEWAAAEGMFAGENPAAAVRKYNPESRRRRALTLAELTKLGEALREAEATGGVKLKDKCTKKEKLRKVSAVALTAVRLLALTGMRRSELLGHESKSRRGPREGLRWGDLDLRAGTVTLQAVGGGSGAKGGESRTLPLGAPALELLRQVKPKKPRPNDPVCPSPKKREQPFVGLDRVREKLYERAGIDGADAHSLRHTFETVTLDVAPAYVGALTGRALTRDSVLNDYLHPDPEVLRPAADRVASVISDAIEGRLGEVLPYRPHKASVGSPA